ncbi:MAG: flagellar hook-basal body complex protein FliE [Clostridiales bacterium]|nr:flagellar hook-basal body complex protein FliE [Clostridiales bacterium]MDK2932278.1 flagellar hook-basal body complex protein FliE [Clostridiales bacterium]
MKINNINNVDLLKSSNTAIGAPSQQKVSFSEFLNNAIANVNQLQNDAAKSNELLAAGKVENLHQVMIDSEKAGIALQFTIQIRNKIMDAYNEIMRMQL